MLSDEEKKAIDLLKEYKEKITFELYPTFDFEEEKALGIILNLIEKQSKEIERLEQKEKEAYNFGYRNGCNDTSKFNDKTFIRIDKIKAKIEEVKDGTYDAKIVLQSLLEKE